MRQNNGSELFGANDPRSTRIGIIEVAPEDDRLSILTAILTQEKLGRQQTVIVLPDQNKAFHHSEDFEELQDTQHKLQTQIVIVASKDSNIVKFARQRGFSVFLSLENYAHYARTFLSQESSREQAEEPVHEPDITNDRKQQESAVPAAPISREDDTTPASPEPVLPEATPTRPLPSEEVSTLSIPPAQAPPQPASASQQLLLPVPLQPLPSPAPATPSDEEHQTATPTLSSGQANITPVAPVGRPAHRISHRIGCRWLIALPVLLLLLLGGSIALEALGGPNVIEPMEQFLPVAASSATIIITPDSKDRKNTYSIFAVTGTPDPSQRQVKARLLSFTTHPQNQKVTASGIGHRPAVAARGTLTFYNALSSTQTIPTGTVFTDANGIKIVNDQPAVIPAANPPTEGTITVNAHAVNAGANGNIPAQDFQAIPCCAPGVTITNMEAFSGGQDAQTYTYIQQSDIDNAVNSLKRALIPGGQEGLQRLILPQEQSARPAECMPLATSDAAAGDQAQSVTVAESVTCVGEVYDQQAAFALAANLLKMEAASEIGTNYALAGHIVATTQETTLTDPNGSVLVSVQAVGKWVYQFNDARKKSLMQLVAGKSMREAQSLLARQAGVRKTSIQVSGGIGNLLPTDPLRINIMPQGT